MKRTGCCGALGEPDANQIHTVMGWVQNTRNMGGVVLIDLRSREGILRAVFDSRNLASDAFAAAEALKPESLIGVKGTLRSREEAPHTFVPDGETIELVVRELEILDPAALGSGEENEKQAQKRRPEIDVESVADLAKLLLSPDEKEAVARDMEEIVEFASRLQAAGTDNIPAAAPADELKNVFREDVPQQPCARELLLANAPERRDGYIFVPQIVE